MSSRHFLLPALIAVMVIGLVSAGGENGYTWSGRQQRRGNRNNDGDSSSSGDQGDSYWYRGFDKTSKPIYRGFNNGNYPYSRYENEYFGTPAYNYNGGSSLNSENLPPVFEGPWPAATGVYHSQFSGRYNDGTYNPNLYPKEWDSRENGGGFD